VNARRVGQSRITSDSKRHHRRRLIGVRIHHSLTAHGAVPEIQKKSDYGLDLNDQQQQVSNGAVINNIILANTRSPEAPAAADIHLHVSPRPASASVCMCAAGTWARARLYVSQPLLSDECPPTCSTGSLALTGCAFCAISFA